MQAPRVGIVGGGILGTVLAYRLAQAGASVTVLERAEGLGGLAASMDFDGHQVDRFYHVITPSDDRMIAMAEELGLGDDLRYAPSGVGFFIDGSCTRSTGSATFSASRRCHRCSARDWLVRGAVPGTPRLRRPRPHSARALAAAPLWRAVVDRIWRPLLDSRFESKPDGLPATYLWARTRRMSSARKGAGKGEVMATSSAGISASSTPLSLQPRATARLSRPAPQSGSRSHQRRRDRRRSGRRDAPLRSHRCDAAAAGTSLPVA